MHAHGAATRLRQTPGAAARSQAGMRGVAVADRGAAGAVRTGVGGRYAGWGWFGRGFGPTESASSAGPARAQLVRYSQFAQSPPMQTAP